MREALKTWGGPCHHMLEVNALRRAEADVARTRGGRAAPSEQLFAGFRSAMDWPSAYYWRELIAFYPQAKVVLTYRTAESWWKSFEQTILQGIKLSTEPELSVSRWFETRSSGGRLDRDHAIEMYEANVKAEGNGRARATAGLHARRRMGTAVRAPRRAGARTALPQSQQRRRLPEGDLKRPPQ